MSKLEYAIIARDHAKGELERQANNVSTLEAKLQNEKGLKRRYELELEAAERRVAELTPVDRSERMLASGRMVPPDNSHTVLKDNGQQQDYVVLTPTPQERAKGFVRPYRDAYVHLGRPACAKTVQSCKAGEGKLLCLKEPGHEGACTDTPIYFHALTDNDDLDKIQCRRRFGGCGTTTTMNSRAICETYARDPGFYSGTYCVSCGKHLPVDQFVWSGTDQQVGS